MDHFAKFIRNAGKPKFERAIVKVEVHGYQLSNCLLNIAIKFGDIGAVQSKALWLTIHRKEVD